MRTARAGKKIKNKALDSQIILIVSKLCSLFVGDVFCGESKLFLSFLSNNVQAVNHTCHCEILQKST